jgi:Flp pilus assembly protein TadD
MVDTVHPLVLKAREALSRSEIKSAELAVDERLKVAGRDINALEVRYQIQKHRGQLGEAARTLDTVIGINARADWAYNELIKLLLTHGKTADAEQVTRNALRANPRNATAHSVLGVIISNTGDLLSGEWHLRHALELAEPQAAFLTGLGTNLTRQRRLDEANDCFVRADTLAPKDTSNLLSWAKLCEARGDLVRAGRLIDTAAAASSPEAVALDRAKLLIRGNKTEEALATLNACRELSGEEQLMRGRLQEQLGNYDDAWQDFIGGKRKMASEAGGLQYKGDAVEALFGRFKQFFTRDNMERMPRARVRTDVPQPIFIMGLPRSGTSVVERIIASHSKVAAGGELAFVSELRKVVSDVLPSQQPFPENLAQSWTADRHYVASLFRDYYLARAERYGLLSTSAGGKEFFTDKMPFNEIYLPLLKMAFPQAKIIHVLRHPLDVLVSMMSNEVTQGFNCGYKIEDAAHHLAAVWDLAEHFRRELDLADYVIRYEALVADPGGQTRRLLDYLGLSYGGLSFDDPRLGLNDRSINRHQHYIERLRPYAGRMGPMLTAYGYE